MANSGNTDVRASLRFTSAVDSAIISSIGEDSETSYSPVRGFASTVDNAMISSVGEEDSEASRSPVRDFASVVNNAMMSSVGEEDSEASRSPVHGFASASGEDRAMRSIGGYLRTSHSPVHGFQLFTLPELVAATNNFSLENTIGAGSFGVVYRAKLADGREVVIKRVETWSKTKKIQENKRVFESELNLLSHLRHKNVVGLIGFCEEKDVRLLVYEYMKKGALYDRLHDKNNVEKGSSVLNSWKMRINIALDASRGIQYLHNYAVPYIQRDIKSSNILLDATWTAKISDFGSRTKAAGTVGYIDSLIGLPAKSDVYAVGVLLLELITGKTAIFNSGEDGGADTPFYIEDFAVSAILAGDLVNILDPRVGPPDVNEAVAVQLVAYTAIHCVNLEEKYRPTMAHIVLTLERALAICDSTHDTISSGTIPVVLHTKRKKKILCCFTMI